MMFIYPPTRFAVSNCLYDQIKHLNSEMAEVIAAYHGSCDIEPLASELCDVIHSAETALRILASDYGVDVLVIQAAVIEKNRVRGYYSEPSELPLAETSRIADAQSCSTGFALPASPFSPAKKEIASNHPMEGAQI